MHLATPVNEGLADVPIFSAVEGPIISAFSFKLGKSLADVTLSQMPTPREAQGSIPREALSSRALFDNSLTLNYPQDRPLPSLRNDLVYYQEISICVPVESHYPQTNKL